MPSIQELQSAFDLTTAQARFVHERPACGFNASEAARRAGYSHNTAGAIGHENLKKPKIQAALAAVCRPLTEKAELTAERVLEECRRIAFSSLTDVLEWDDDGARVKPSDELTPGAAAAIRSIEITETREAGDEGEVLDRKVQVRTQSKERALRQLGKYLGLWKDPYEVQAEILEVFEGMSPKELNKKLEEMGDDLMELVGKHGIYRLLSVVHGL